MPFDFELYFVSSKDLTNNNHIQRINIKTKKSSDRGLRKYDLTQHLLLQTGL